jgi:hypothetical protein
LPPTKRVYPYFSPPATFIKEEEEEEEEEEEKEKRFPWPDESIHSEGQRQRARWKSQP